MPSPEPNSETDANVSRLAVMAVVGLTAVICLCGIIYVRDEHAAYDSEIHLRLSTAAENKSARLIAWRLGRVGDVRSLAAATKLMPAVARALTGGASPIQLRQVSDLLDTVRVQYNYENVVLTGLTGVVKLSSGPLQGDPAYYSDLTTATLRRSDHVFFSDFSPAPSGGSARLSVSAEVVNESGVPIGILVLGIDPTHELYPALQDWPGEGRSGELRLARRDGESVLFLNPSRMAGGVQLLQRRPVVSGLHVAKASGSVAEVDGTDYRGVAVLAVARPIAGTDWFVVAKIDRAEAFEPQVRDAIRMGIVCLLLAGMTVSLGLLLLRRHHVAMYRQKYLAEQAQKELLERYKVIVRYANDAILLSTRDGRIVEANERASSMFGYSRQELLNLSLPALKPEGSDSLYFELMARIYTEGSVLFETVNLRKDGRTFPTEISSCLVQVDGQTMCQAIVRDISERKETERQIAQLNHLYAVLGRCNAACFRAASEEDLVRDVCTISVESGGFRIAWVGKVDPQTKEVVPVAIAGPEASYLHEIRITADGGPTSLGPTGTCIREGRAVASADFSVDETMAVFRAAASRHGLRSSICLPLQRRGETVYVFGLYSSQPGFFTPDEIALADEVGKGLSLALDRFDLQDEREAAQKQLLSTSERLELALDASNEGYWDWLIGPDQWYASPRFFTMLGYEPGAFALNLEVLKERNHPDDAAELSRRLSLVASGEMTTSSVEFRARHQQGHYIWIEGFAKVASRDNAGLPTRIVGTRIDISKRKLLEEELQQAQKMESVGRLAAAVAHDFNNFLTVINGYSSLILGQLPGDSPYSKHLEAIHDAGQRSAALTRQLLSFSRKGIERNEVVSINKVISEVHGMLTRLMGGNLALDIDLDPEATFVLADATRLEQVVMNLAINARDAIHREGTVSISTLLVNLKGDKGGVDRTGAFVRLSVSDTGTGITPEVQLRLFEPFFTTKTKGIGTGLGLATVRAIVESCRGFIEVESELGRGTAFHVFLPLVENITPAPGTAQILPVRDANCRGTLLLVEDQDDVRRFASEILKGAGHRVLPAADGPAALAISASYRSRIDLVVSDVMMPGMTGPELIHSLQQSRPGLKALFVSGYADGSIHPGDLETSGAEFLSKPYEPKALLSSVCRLLGESLK